MRRRRRSKGAQKLDHLAATKLDLNTWEALRQSAHRRGLPFSVELRRRLLASLEWDPVPERRVEEGDGLVVSEREE